jgi:glycosyltransferase involved in cell wall biosynthesis
MTLKRLPISSKLDATGACTKIAAKPRICILTETYYPQIGGGESQAQSLALGLIDNGYSVTIVTRRTNAKLNKYERYRNTPINRIPPIGEEHYKKWGLLFTGFLALLKLASEYDVILVSGFRILGVPAVLASKFLGKRCILKADNNGEMSGEYFRGGLQKIRLRPQSIPFKLYLSIRNKIFSRANGFVAISNDIAVELKNNRINKEKLIYRIPNSVNSDIFCPADPMEKNNLRLRLNLPAGEPLITYTGRLVSYKGLPLLLKVWVDIVQKYPQARLLLVGGGSLDIYNCEIDLKNFIENNRLQDSVILVGEVINVHEYLKASDIFVFPTQKEAFGISLIEAMACGLPVITTPVGGLKDIVQDGINGLVVEAGNSNQLFDALDKLISKRELRSQFAEASRQTIMDRYSTDIVTRQYIEVFNHVYHSKS